MTTRIAPKTSVQPGGSNVSSTAHFVVLQPHLVQGVGSAVTEQETVFVQGQ